MFRLSYFGSWRGSAATAVFGLDAVEVALLIVPCCWFDCCVVCVVLTIVLAVRLASYGPVVLIVAWIVAVLIQLQHHHHCVVPTVLL